MSKVARNSIVLMVSQILGKVISFVFIVFIARYLGSQDFGKYSFVIAFIVIPNILVTFGMDSLLVREVARDKDRYSVYVSNVFFLKSVFAVFMVFAVFVLVNVTGISGDPVKSVCLMVFSFTIILNPLQQTLWAVSDAYEEMQYHSLLFIIWNLIRTFLGIGILYGGYGLNTLFMGFLVSEAVNLAVSYTVISGRFGVPEWKIDIKFCRSLLKATLPLAVFHICIIICQRVDTIILSIVSGDRAAGWYNAAHNLMLALLFIPTSIVNSAFPHLSQNFNKSKELFMNTYFNTFKYLFLIGLPLAVWTTFLSGKIISLFYDVEYANSAVILQILIWSLFMSFMNSLLANTIIAMNKERIIAGILGAATVTNIALNVILVPLGGYIGAAVSRIGCDAVIMVAGSVVFYRSFSRIPFPAVCVKILIMNAAVFAGVYMLGDLPLLLTAALVVGIYGGASFALGLLGKYEVVAMKNAVRGMFG